MFSFHHWLLLLFFWFFDFTNFLYHNCFFVRHFICVLLCHECYGFERAFLLLGILTLYAFPTFGTTCFHQGFPGSSQFFLKGCRTFHWGSKCNTGSSVCLSHTVFSQRYLSVGSIYVLRPYATQYQPFQLKSYPLGHKCS